MLFDLPDKETLYIALCERDDSYEGRAWVGVTSTGIFCRLTCPARKPKPGQISLSSVGGAVEAFAKSIAAEIAPKRINVVSPGIIDTPMVALAGDDRAKHYKNVTKSHLIKRSGEAKEVAMGILFAIENDFITGTTIDVDGGWLAAQV